MLFHDLALQSDITSLGDLVIVTADGSVPDVRQGLEAVVADRAGAIVKAYRLDRPRDGRSRVAQWSMAATLAG